MSELTSSSPRPVVQWVSRATAPLARALPEAGPIGAIATSIRGAAHLENTISVAGEHGLGVFVDTEAWRTQLEPDDPARAEEFRRVGLDWTPNRRFVPSEATVSGADRNQIVASHRDAQVSAGGTLLVSPCHRVRETAPLSRGRRLDIALAHDFTALARSSGGAHPTPQGGLPRSVAIALAVDARTLEPKVTKELIAGYREIETDLFWIWVWNFEPSGIQYDRVRSLAGGLQNESRTPCLLGGIGRLYQAALRNQIGAVCQGWGRNELPFPPPDPPEVVEGEEDDAGWGVHVFHPGILGTTKLGIDKTASITKHRFGSYFGYSPATAAIIRLTSCPPPSPIVTRTIATASKRHRWRRFASRPQRPAPSSPRSSQRPKKCVLSLNSVLCGQGGARPRKTPPSSGGSSFPPTSGGAAPRGRLP